MSEKDVREGLYAAIADEPPLNLDPDALVATGRRQIRRRRALVSVSVATAAVAVAAVALPVLLAAPGDQNGVAPAERPAATSTVPVEPPKPSPWPPAGVRTPDYTAEQLRERGERMRAHLGEALPAALPGATDVAVGPFGGEAAGDVSDGQTYLNTFAAFTLDGARTAIGVDVFAPGAFQDGPATLCAQASGHCELLLVASGRGQVLAVEVDAGGPTAEILTVYHFREDGSVVSATGYNYDPTAGTPATERPMPTAESLAAVAVDPALRL